MSALALYRGKHVAMPVDAMFAAIPSLPRAVLARLTERLIDRLDEIDGDADAELNGDELDGTLGEDDFVDHGPTYRWGGGPGCPIADQW